MKIIGIVCLLTLFSCDVLIDSGVNKTCICITFDDQDLSIYDNALPLMQEFGFTATNVINTAQIGNEGHLNWQQVEELEFVYGWETAGHTLHHVVLPEINNEEAEYEIYQDWLNLQDHGLSHDTFALPSGHATEEQFEIILNYYKNIRTSRDLKHFYPINRTYLGYFFYDSEYNAQDAISRIIRGVENKEALIILGFHQFQEENTGYPANCTPVDFRQILEFIHYNELEVLTIKEAVDKLSN